MIVFRKIKELKNVACSFLRVIRVKLIYNTIKVDWKTRIGKNVSIHCDNDSSICLENVILADGVNIQVKRGGSLKISHSFIGLNSVIVSINSISIEKGCEIAEMVVVRDQNHNFDFSDIPIKKQGYSHKPILIKENVWIGAKATILGGVTIGKNSLVGAHSLVNKSFPHQSLILGIPAKKIDK